jgi:hypothetical protein
MLPFPPGSASPLLSLLTLFLFQGAIQKHAGHEPCNSILFLQGSCHMCFSCLSQDPILLSRVTTPALLKFTTPPWAYVVRIKIKNILLYFEKCYSLLQRWRCSCKFRSCRIGSRLISVCKVRLLPTEGFLSPCKTQESLSLPS